MTSYIQTDLLGQGSYGKVYKISKNEDQNLALKKIPNNNNGCTCLLEAAIMANIRHSNINPSHEIYINSDNTFIISPLATCDLSILYRENIIHPKKMAYYLYQLTTAVALLHKLNIVHADIKPRNVLYYAEDDSIKLTDFTLSAKLWKNNDSFRRSACTYNYSPPEYLRGDYWDKKLDIWSLGCTFYEVIFGRVLFPNQARYKQNKHNTKMAYYNSIIHWFQQQHKFYEYVTGIEFIRTEMNSKFSHQSNSTISALILKMLQFDPDDRITIDEILKSQYFAKHLSSEINKSELRYVEYDMISISQQMNMKILVVEVLRDTICGIEIQAHSLTIMSINNITKLATNITSACSPLRCDYDVDLLNITSIFMAAKIIVGKALPCKSKFSLSEIVQMEQKICIYLQFCIPIFHDIDKASREEPKAESSSSSSDMN